MLLVKNKKLAFLAALVISAVLLSVAMPARFLSAQGMREFTCSDGTVRRVPSSEQITQAQACADVTESAGENSANTSEPQYVPNDCNEGSNNNSENCGIIGYLVIFINVLSVLAGIVIAGSIAYGGIEYSMSGSDPQRVSAAKDRIRNAIIALVFFIFGYAILNYLVPGGVL